MKYVLLFFLLFTSCGITANAILLNPSTSQPAQSEQISIVVTVSNISDLAGIQMILLYDNLEYESANEGSFLSENDAISTLFSLNTSTPNQIRLTLLRLDGLGASGNGTLVTFDFRTLMGTATVKFDDLLLADNNALPINITSKNLTLTIQGSTPTQSSPAAGGGGGGGGSAVPQSSSPTTANQNENKQSQEDTTPIISVQQQTPQSISERSPSQDRTLTQSPLSPSPSPFPWLYVFCGTLLALILGLVIFKARAKEPKDSKDLPQNDSVVLQSQQATPTVSQLTLKTDSPAILAGVQYVKKARQQGQSDSRIRLDFTKRGWRTDQIDELFKRVNS